MALDQVKTCVICDRYINIKHTACYEHTPYYLANKEQPWMQELIKMERKQASISVMESLPIFDFVEHGKIVGTIENYRDVLVVAEKKHLQTENKDIARKYKTTSPNINHILKKHYISK